MTRSQPFHRTGGIERTGFLENIVTFIDLTESRMKGIHYLTDDQNRKVAVQIDLKEHGKLWEDFYDNLVAELRKEEEKLSLDTVISDLQKEGKLDEEIHRHH